MEQRQRRTLVLDPVSRTQEIIFGLVMVLSFTGSLSVATAGREEVRTVLVAALGCNLAWGIVDAVMYVIGAASERARNLVLWRDVRDEHRATAVMAEALPERVVAALGPEGMEALRQRLLALPEPPRRAGFVPDDLIGAAGVFLLVVLATFPVVVPFLLFSETALAMRVSNGVAVALLFAAGWSLARYAGLVPWRTGLALAGVGAVLSFVIIALGG